MTIANLIPGQPLLSWMLVLIGASLILYFIRPSAHHLLNSLMQMLIQMMRLFSRALAGIARTMAQRNREVLLEHGREQAQRELERQFIRLGALVEKDLSRYPDIQREMQHNISAMEDKLSQTSDVPAPLPEWTEAVESISKLKDSTKNDAVVGKLLMAIHEAFQLQQKEVMVDYRKDVSERHGILKSAMNHWRHLLNKMSHVEKHWQHLNEQANKIDLHVERFENLNAGTDSALNILKSSASTQFFISIVVMIIAGFGAFVNYNLIALPMSELMPATSQVGGFNVADIGAAVIIMLELTVGLFFMEAVGITRLFPVIHFMEDKKRLIWAWVCMLFLLSLCFVEAGLAYMREVMVADKAMLTSFLVGGENAANQAAHTETSHIPMIGQMVLGFVLPLILMFVAIPFESFIHTGRHVLGNILVQIFLLLSTVLRSLSIFLRQLNNILKSIYDILCFVPIWIEQLIESRPSKMEHTKEEPKIVENNPELLENMESKHDAQTHIEPTLDDDTGKSNA